MLQHVIGIPEFCCPIASVMLRRFSATPVRRTAMESEKGSASTAASIASPTAAIAFTQIAIVTAITSLDHSAKFVDDGQNDQADHQHHQNLMNKS